MRFTLKLVCENEAFEDDAGVEIARILFALGDRVAGLVHRGNGAHSGNLRDVNGNTVGCWVCSESAVDHVPTQLRKGSK